MDVASRQPSGVGPASGDLAIVVVAFGGAVELGRCLRSVKGYDALVVDNSSDPSVAAVTRAENVPYLDAGRNRGFAGGVNLALAHLNDRGFCGDVLLLNPDATVDPRAVDLLLAARDRAGAERVACFTPALVSMSGGRQREIWPFPSPTRAWLEAFGLGFRQRQHDFAVGTALLIRGPALREVGPFDERFFLYAEEVDWQRRARSLGWGCELVPEAVVHHVGGGTSRDPGRREALFFAAGETYVRKWFGPAGWAGYRLAVIIGCLPRIVLGGEDTRRRALSRLRIHVAGPRRVAGMTS